jgi:hypothetical protein
MKSIDTGCGVTKFVPGKPIEIEVSDKRGPLLVEVCTFTGQPLYTIKYHNHQGSDVWPPTFWRGTGMEVPGRTGKTSQS